MNFQFFQHLLVLLFLIFLLLMLSLLRFISALLSLNINRKYLEWPYYLNKPLLAFASLLTFIFPIFFMYIYSAIYSFQTFLFGGNKRDLENNIAFLSIMYFVAGSICNYEKKYSLILVFETNNFLT